MKALWKPLLALSILAAPLLAGAMFLEIGNPAANPEALAKHAVLVARITACHAPEKSTITATAEGIVDGARKSIPLKVIPLSAAGTFAVAREWPEQGAWAVKMSATNPEYKNYTTSVVVPMQNNSMQWANAKHYSHAATDSEVSAALN